MKKILLTGSNGFVASRFYEYYKDRYHFILVNRANLDVTDEEKVVRLFQEENIDIVFHMAAIADINACQNNPALAYKTNVQASINLAKGCALKNSTLVFAGSDQIFSANTEDGPYTEDTLALAGNVYAETKLKAEQEIAALLERYYNLRFTWMFSMPEKNKKTAGGIIFNVLKALMSDTPLGLNENDYRGFTYVYEVIENFERILELPFGTYNAGSENDRSAYEIGRTVFKALNVPRHRAKLLQPISGNRRDLRISNEKLKSYGVRFSLSEQAVRRCVREFI